MRSPLVYFQVDNSAPTVFTPDVDVIIDFAAPVDGSIVSSWDLPAMLELFSSSLISVLALLTSVENAISVFCISALDSEANALSG